jgi:hypothetical protein
MFWDIVGNPNTNPNSDFLGTTDAQPLVVKTNGAERMRIIPDGRVGIGTNAPDKTLSVREATSSLRFGHEGGPAVLRVENSGAGSLAALNLGNTARNWQLRVDGNDGNKFKIFDATAIADRLAIDTAGNVGIGTPNPGARLEINNGDLLFKAAADDPGDVIFQSASGGQKGRIWSNPSAGAGLFLSSGDNTPRLSITAAGNVGIGTVQPSARLSVIAPGASELSGATRSSTLLTSAGSLAAASGSELALASIGFHSGNNTSLGIRAVRTANGGDWGTTAIGLGMDVDNTVRAGGASLWIHASGKVGVGGIGASRARLEILDTAPSTAGTGAQAAVFAHSLERHGVYGLTSSKTTSYYAAVFGDNEGGGTGVIGVSRGSGAGVRGTSDTGYGVTGSAGGDFGIGVEGSNSAGRGIGVLGRSTASRAVVGINGSTGIPSDVGADFGVGGISVNGVGAGGRTAASSYAGVEGVSTGATGAGIYGWTNASGGYGIRGRNTAGGYAAAFEGRVHVAGLITATSKAFQIDHPLDPANKTLQHSSVESPDMLCVYNGNVTTNARGKATVVLPDYFEALNRDYRYQLTAVGQRAQANVEHEIKGNRFTIETDKPNVKVSWQVVGVRQDAYAETNREPVEQDKPEARRGRYLHPALHGDLDTDTSWFGTTRSMFAETGSLSEGLPVDDPSDTDEDPL